MPLGSSVKIIEDAIDEIDEISMQSTEWEVVGISDGESCAAHQGIGMWQMPGYGRSGMIREDVFPGTTSQDVGIDVVAEASWQ